MHLDNVWVLQFQQDVDFTDRGDRKPIALLFHLQPLESTDLPGLKVPSLVHHTVGALLDSIHLLVQRDVSALGDGRG